MEKIVFSTNGVGITGHPHVKKKKKERGKKSRHRLDTLHKINSKWIVDLNIKHKTIKFLEDNTGEKLLVLGMMMTF